MIWLDINDREILKGSKIVNIDTNEVFIADYNLLNSLESKDIIFETKRLYDYRLGE